MRLPSCILRRLHAVLMDRVANRREPDFTVMNAGGPYLRRWWVIPRNRVFNIYLHQFVASDEDRALHDHPWINLSVLLDGAYREYMTHDRCRYREAGDVVLRGPRAAHRVELFKRWVVRGGEVTGFVMCPVWTLFITGPRVRQWGFLCPQGWRHWKEFTAGKNGERVGRGCE